MSSRSRCRSLCPHCGQLLSLKMFKAHKRRYYDSSSSTWLSKQTLVAQEDATEDMDAQDQHQEHEPRPESPPASFLPPPHSLLTDESGLSQNTVEVDLSDVDVEDSGAGSNEIEVWDCQEEELEDSFPPPCGALDQASENSLTSKALVAWILSFLFFIRFTYGLSDTLSNLILKFLGVLFKVLSAFCQYCKEIAAQLPSTLYAVQNTYSHMRKCIVQYVVCRECFSVYNKKDCIDGTIDRRSKKCPHKSFPRHPHRRMRGECGSVLLKKVVLSSGKEILYPYMVYCYLSVKQSLHFLLTRENLLSKCGSWTMANSDSLHDVYDGKVWKDFLYCKGKPFLADPCTVGLTLNIDWFQPFKHTTYSVGAIYITIMNLPRNIRYKRENVILCGLIPGPQEPSTLDTFLKPLVSELLELWKGVEMKINGANKVIRGALLCVACDIPAGRKVCGFLGHNAHYGCSRCLKYFTGSVGSMDFSGFNRSEWVSRSPVQHRKVASKVTKALTKSEAERIASESGYRSTELLKLPYFNPCRMLIVDPMHNLFIGTAKRMMKSLWMERGMVGSTDLEVIQKRISNSFCPPDIGRIPLKIESGFSHLTADQLKNWVLYFSVVALRDIITGEDMECWRHFVLACRLLSHKELQVSDVRLADAFLLQFCSRVERMYGKSFITPNFHLHAHIRECILDYGPLHGFWLFSFERYNGILGKIATNNRSIEHQFMKRFLEDNELSCFPNPDMYTEDFAPVFSARPSCGSANESTFDVPADPVLLPKHYVRGVFTSFETKELQGLYSKLYHIPAHSIDTCCMFKKYSTICFKGKHVGSKDSRSKNSSIVLVRWNDSLFGPNTSSEQYRPVIINFFAQQSLLIGECTYNPVLCSVSWFKPRLDKDIYGKPVTIWEHDIFETNFPSVIPVQSMSLRTVSLIDQIATGETVLFVTPCTEF